MDHDPAPKPDPVFFFICFQDGFQDASRNNNFFSKFFFAYCLLLVDLRQSSKVKAAVSRSHKTVAIKVFQKSFLVDTRIKNYGSGSRRPKV
jgi:hypothetical protein